MQVIKKFAKDERGVIAIELCLVVPILVWVLMSTIVYFDVFRNEANAGRASLTIADMFSREQDAIDDDYLDGAQALLRLLTFAEDSPDLRVSVYRYILADDEYVSVWSRIRGEGTAMTDEELLVLQTANRLPVLADDDVAILIETNTDYSAPFSVGLGPFTGTDIQDLTFTNFTVIRPRYVDSLCFDIKDSSAPNGGIIC